MCYDLKNVDIFGTKFKFNNFKKSSIKTFFGATISIICITIMSLFTFLLVIDFYYKRNPRIQFKLKTREIYPEPFLLNAENMFLAWRISSIYSKTINDTGIVYPEITHFVYDNVKNKLITQTNISYVKCSEKSVFNEEFSKYFNPEVWYCLDWSKTSNLTFGGYWDDNYINYFDISLRSCPMLIFTKNGCTSKEKLIEVFSSEENFYFDLVYPEYSLCPMK
jgi:hypothetical protein